MSLNLTGLNGVQTALAAAVTNVATSISVNAADAPWKTPPDPAADFYYLTLVDYSNRPAAWERVKVTARSGTGPYTLTVERNIDSSTGSGIAFSAGALIQWTPGVEEMSTASGKMVLSCGGNLSPFLLRPNSSSPEFLVPAGIATDTFGSSPNDDTFMRWYNNTGDDLTVNQLFLYANQDTSDTVTITVQIDGVDTAITLDVLSADQTVITKRDTVNTAVIADGSYLSIKASSLAASPSGFVRVYRLAIVVQ